MIDFIMDPDDQGFVGITTFPHTMKGAIVIVSNNRKFLRFPGWGDGKVVVKVDENYVYMKSDTEGKIDLYDRKAVKIKEINEDELK